MIKLWNHGKYPRIWYNLVSEYKQLVKKHLTELYSSTKKEKVYKNEDYANLSEKLIHIIYFPFILMAVV
jgi:hypothetical protein